MEYEVYDQSDVPGYSGVLPCLVLVAVVPMSARQEVIDLLHVMPWGETVQVSWSVSVAGGLSWIYVHAKDATAAGCALELVQRVLPVRFEVQDSETV